MLTHIFNVSAILSADNIKYTNVFLPYSFLSSFFKLREREREYVIAVLRKGVGRNSFKVYLAFWRVPSGSIFSFTGSRGVIYSLVWRRLLSSCPRFFPLFPGNFGGSFNTSYHINYCPENPGSASSPGVWHEIHPTVHGDICF